MYHLKDERNRTVLGWGGKGDLCVPLQLTCVQARYVNLKCLCLSYINTKQAPVCLVEDFSVSNELLNLRIVLIKNIFKCNSVFLCSFCSVLFFILKRGFTQESLFLRVGRGSSLQWTQCPPFVLLWAAMILTYCAGNLLSKKRVKTS